MSTQTNTTSVKRWRGRSGKGARIARRWILRVSLAFATIVVLLSGSGALYQEVASRSDRSQLPAPGRMIAVGSHQLHIQEAGTAHDGPSVVLLAGAGSMSTQWAWIQDDVADFARVISYDRAGLGWSEASGHAQDARTVAEELYRVLKVAEVPGPYVLVGHSLGGAQARVFADLYPDEVAGMVLLDPVSPEFWTRVEPDALDESRNAARQAKLFPYLARLGVLRALDPFAAATEGLPEEQREEAKAMFASTRHAATSSKDYQEVLEMAPTMELLRNATPVTDMPLVVLTRTEPDDAYTGPQQEIDAELAATSSLGSHRLVNGVDHITMVTEEAHARKTTEAIRFLLELVNGRE